MSNNQTSNLEPPTSNTAITLIAIIITIIVLLILAGVTLSMVMGENGIINKAKQAQEKTMYSQYKEELQMCVAEVQADEAEQGRTATLEKIREMLPMKAKKLYNITDDEISINAIKETASIKKLAEQASLNGITKIAEVAETTEEYANSGIEKYEYHVIDENNKEEIYTTNVINNLTGTKYTVYVIAYDRAGNYTQTEKINVKVTRRYKEIEASQYSTWAIDEKGNLWYTGGMRYGNPNDGGNPTSAYKFTKILDGKNLNKISFGLNEDHILALDNENNLYAWGHNTHGQIGNGISQNANYGITEIKKDEVKFKEIASDNGVSRAIDENGGIWTWGNHVFSPTKLETNGVKFIQISSGYGYYIAIDEEGNIWSWGSNQYGQLGQEKFGGSLEVPTKVETESIKGIKFTKVSAGNDHSVALDENGSIWTCGRGTWGMLATGNTDTYGNTTFQKVE